MAIVDPGTGSCRLYYDGKHRWTIDDGEVSAATCTAAAIHRYACECGATTTKSYGSALGHNPGSWETTTAATCTSNGTKVQKCTRCGATVNTGTITKTGHSYGPYTTLSSPTCEESGMKVRYCTVCGASSYSYPSALGHDWNEEVVLTQKTCTSDGEMQYTCKRTGCGKQKTEPIPQGHTWNDGVVTTEPTCTEAGVETYTCTVCNETREEILEALGHSYSGGQCTRCQMPQDYSVGLSFTSYGNGTCYLSGIGSCADTAIRVPPKSGITTGDTVVSIGSRTSSLYVFDGTGVESVELPDTVTDIGRGAFYNCSSLKEIRMGDAVETIGNDAFSSCTALQSIVLSKSLQTIGQYAFNYCRTLTSVEVPATLTSIGRYAFNNVPSTCVLNYHGSQTQWNAITKGSYWYGSMSSSSFVMEAHRFGSPVTTEPTCTEDGFTERVCSYCGKVERTQGDPPLGHDWDAGTQTVAPTCTSVGKTQFTCTRCGTTNLVDIQMLPHTPSTEDEFWCSAHGGQFLTPSTGLLFDAVEEDAYEVAGIGSCVDSALVIPADYNSKQIVSIKPGALRNNASLTSVYVSRNAKMGFGSLAGCSNVAKISIPTDALDDHSLAFAFGSAHLEDNSAAFPAALKEVEITWGTKLPDFALAGCQSIDRVTLPTAHEHELSSFGVAPFYGCTSLVKNGCYKGLSVTKVVGDAERYFARKEEIVESSESTSESKEYEKISAGGDLELNKNGVHYCSNLFDVFNYYNGEYGKDFVIASCSASSEKIESPYDSTCCARWVKVERILTLTELLELINSYADPEA